MLMNTVNAHFKSLAHLLGHLQVWRVLQTNAKGVYLGEPSLLTTDVEKIQLVQLQMYTCLLQNTAKNTPAWHHHA
jgi:hypothetical protein